MAATVVDALVVSLSLDATNYNKGMAQAVAALAALSKQSGQVNLALNQTGTVATRTAATMQAKGKVAGEFFGQIKNQALSLIGVLLGGRSILGFAEHGTTSLAAMGREARNTGDSLEALASLRNAVQAGGGNADAAVAARRKIADSLQEIKTTGNSANLAVMARTIGVHPEDSPEQTLSRFLDWADRYKSNPLLVRQQGAELGYDEGTINLALKGRVQAEKELAEARARGVPTAEMIEKVTALQGAWFRMTQTAEGLANVLLADFAPALTAILNAITAFMSAHPDISKGIGVAAVAATGAAGVATTIGIAKGLLGRGAAAAAAAAPSAVAAAAGAGWLGRLAGVAASLPASTLSFLLWSSPTNANEAELLARQRAAGAAGGGGAGPTPSAANASALFASIETAQGLPAGILDAVWEAESGRGRHMRSPAGAKGHMGFMDATAREYGVDNPDDLGQSSRGSGKDLHDLLRKYGGDPRKALAAYNWGQGNLDKDIASRGADWERGLPAETSAYLARIGRTMSGANRYPGQGGGAQSQNISVTGPITIHTAANDAGGIARDFRRELSGRRIAQQANSGLA